MTRPLLILLLLAACSTASEPARHIVVAGPTTAVVRPEPRKVSRGTPRTPTPVAPLTRPSGDDVWRRLANCEASRGQDSANGNYHGFFQFSLSTWRSVGGTGDPHTFSYEHQREMAQRLQARSGWGQWPTCSRKIGVR